MPLLSCFVHAQTASCCIEKSATLPYPHSGLESRGPADRDVITRERPWVIPALAGGRRQAEHRRWFLVYAAHTAICLGFAVAMVLLSGAAGAQKQHVINYYNWS